MVIPFKKIIVCLFSIILLGMSSAICIKVGFGTNSVVTLFSGISKTFNINIGIATNVVNVILTIVAFFINKNHINIGTFIYSFLLGTFINFFLPIVNIPDSLIFQIPFASLGIVIYFIAISFFIWSNIGVNPWIAFALIFSEKFKKPFGRMKLFVDVSCLICGICLGGRFGPVTVITAFLCGPCVEKILSFLKKIRLE